MEQEEPLMARDQLDEIKRWYDLVSKELRLERISYGELTEIEHIYESVKVFLKEG